jgi:hypothetical protein
MDIFLTGVGAFARKSDHNQELTNQNTVFHFLEREHHLQIDTPVCCLSVEWSIGQRD